MLGTYLRGDTLGWLNANARVPLSRRKHCDLVQKFINTSQQIFTVVSMVGNIMENLKKTRKQTLR